MYESEYITNNAHETEQLGGRLALELSGKNVFALFGDLGAGKTAFTRGVAAALECIDSVSSPTYTIVNEYRGKRKVCHFDMYRILDSDSLYDIGWEDYLASGSLCVVEWSENIKDALPKSAVYITFEKLSDEQRRIKVSYDNSCT